MTAPMPEKKKRSTQTRPNRTVEALIILRDIRPETYAYFAELFWPNNDMHRRHSNAGNRHASRRGAGAWLCAGSFLGKLAKKGLITKRYPRNLRYITVPGGIAWLTEDGKDYLRKNAGRS